MKKIFFSILSIGLCLLLVASCEDELPVQANYTDYDFSGLDSDGGTWRTVLLASSYQITIAPPDDEASDAYQNELAAVKTATTNLTDDQRKAVEYWTNNPVIRWNEIALELAAKYNLIPG